MTAQASPLASLLAAKQVNDKAVETSEVSDMIDKQCVAASFSAAAVNYDELAAIQKDVGAKLLQGIPPDQDYQFVADVGCGTGWLTRKLRQCFPMAHLLGIDIAQGMIDYAIENRRVTADSWWVADMEALPIVSESLDLLYSNLAMQWLPDPQYWFTEASRVLLPGGHLLCSTLLPGTLNELETCWNYADQQLHSGTKNAHINHFSSQTELMQAARAAGFEGNIVTYRDIQHHASVRKLMAELKGIGANNLNSSRPRSVTSKGRIRLMLEHYEQFRTTNGYPATFEVALLTLTKAIRLKKTNR